MQQKITLLLLLGYLSFTAQAQQMLTVFDAQNMQPLEYVLLLSETPKRTAYSNAKGQIDLSLFPSESPLELRYLGYQPWQGTFDDLKQLNFQISLKPGSQSLNTVVISANKRIQLSNEVPQRTVSISSKDVARFQPQTAADLLAQSGEVFIQKSQQGGGSPMIRGFSANRLLYAVDGVRMNTAIFRSGNLQNLISLDPLNLENAEVILGPGSVMYGSDALGGVMSFSSLQPRFQVAEENALSGGALMRYSSANREQTGHLHLKAAGKRWAYVGSLSHNRFDDLRMGRFGPDEYLRPFYVSRIDSTDRVVSNPDPLLQKPSGYEQINLMQKIRFKAAKHLELEYALHYSNISDFPRYDRLIATQNNVPRSAEWFYGPQVWQMQVFSLFHRKTTVLYDELSVKWAYQNFKESRIDRNFNSARRRTLSEEVDAYSLNAEFNKRLSSKHKISYGLEGIINQVFSAGRSDFLDGRPSQAVAARYPRATWASYAVYASHLWQWSKSFQIQSGLRYNLYQMDARFDTALVNLPETNINLQNAAFSGSVGFTWQWLDKWLLRGQVARAFRAPNVDDAGKLFDSQAGLVIVPNNNLRAEFANQAEVGVTTLITQKISVSLGTFYTRMNNAMVRRPFTLNGQDSIEYNNVLSRVDAIQNAAFAEIIGAYFAADWILKNGFTFKTRLNWQNGEEELDDGSRSPLRHAAPFFGFAMLNYQKGPLWLMLQTQFSGQITYDNLSFEGRNNPILFAKDGNGNPYSPAWAILNFRMAYQHDTHWTINAGLENIFDLRYRTYSSGIAAPGRNFSLSGQFKF